MSQIHSQDAMLAAALSTLGSEGAAPIAAPIAAPMQRVETRRRNAAETDAIGVWTVAIGTRVVLVHDKAMTAGEAVLATLAECKAAGITGVGGSVFMWDYLCVNEADEILKGSDPVMRDSLERARINTRRS